MLSIVNSVSLNTKKKRKKKKHNKGLCNNYLEGGSQINRGGGPELKPKRRVGGVRCNFLNICRGG